MEKKKFQKKMNDDNFIFHFIFVDARKIQVGCIERGLRVYSRDIYSVHKGEITPYSSKK